MKDTKSLERISSNLINLTNLYCQDFNGSYANPCCKATSYKSGIKMMFPNLKALDGQRLALSKQIDMNDLGLDNNDDGQDVEYDIGDAVFYSEEIADGISMNTNNTKMAPEVKKECVEFDKLLADCEAFLNRKTEIILL